MANPTPQYLHNERANRYVDARTRRFVPQSRVTAALNDVIDAAAAEMKAASVGLQTGQITLAQFQLIFEKGIKNINITSYVMARGGYAQMSPSDWGRVGREIRTQYEFARRMYGQIASGQQRLNGTFTQRVLQYVEAGRVTYEKERARQAVLRQRIYARRIRHARDSCAGCIRLAGLGYVLIDGPDYVPIGGTDCINKCKCTQQFATAEEAGIVEEIAA